MGFPGHHAAPSLRHKLFLSSASYVGQQRGTRLTMLLRLTVQSGSVPTPSRIEGE